MRRHPRLHLLAASLAAAVSWVVALTWLTALLGWPSLLLVGAGMPLAGVFLRRRGGLWRALCAGPAAVIIFGLTLDAAEPVLRAPGWRPVTDPILAACVWGLLGLAVVWLALWPSAFLLRAGRRLRRAGRDRTGPGRVGR